MMKISPLCLLILRLKASNDNLLKLYNKLQEEVDKEDDAEHKKDWETRVALRNKISKELRVCFRRIKTHNQYSPLEGSLIFGLPFYVNLEYTIKDLLKENSWSACNKWERKNLKLYYKTLYDKNVKDDVTFFLLKQKRELENVIFSSN